MISLDRKDQTSRWNRTRKKIAPKQEEASGNKKQPPAWQYRTRPDVAPSEKNVFGR